MPVASADLPLEGVATSPDQNLINWISSDVAPNFYPALSSFQGSGLPCWAGDGAELYADFTPPA